MDDAGTADSSEDGPEDDPEPDDHALPPEDLQYPEFSFEDGQVGDRGGFDLARDVDRGEMADWLTDLAGGLASHDVAVESPDGYVTFGVGPDAVEMSFDPDENCRGELEVTFRLRAKAMFVADDPDQPKVGARGGRGFVPLEMLTGDLDDYRCYNWIDDPRADGAADAGDAGDADGADAGGERTDGTDCGETGSTAGDEADGTDGGETGDTDGGETGDTDGDRTDSTDGDEIDAAAADADGAS